MKQILILLIFFCSKLFSQDSPKDEESKRVKDGWAILIGAGFMYGGNIGLLTEKQILIKEKLRVSPFVSLGIAEGGNDSILNTKYFWFGYAVGANLEYGKKHRVIFGPHFVGQNLIGNSVVVKKNFLPAFSFIVGYKGTARFGLIWQVYIGDIYMQNDPLKNNENFSHSNHVGIGIGYKF